MMIERREELDNIKSKDASCQILDPPHANEMSQCYAYISHRLRLETSKLALINKVIRDYLELKPLTNDFFNQLVQGVKQNDWSERFEYIV